MTEKFWWFHSTKDGEKDGNFKYGNSVLRKLQLQDDNFENGEVLRSPPGLEVTVFEVNSFRSQQLLPKDVFGEKAEGDNR